MDIHALVNAWFHQTGDLYNRLRSSEGQTTTEVELRIIRAELFLLELQTRNILDALAARQEKPRSDDSKLPPEGK